MARFVQGCIVLIVAAITLPILLEIRHVVLWRRIEVATPTITVGMTRDQVVARLGMPQDSVSSKRGGKLYYWYRPHQPIPLLRRPYTQIKFSHDVVEQVVLYPDANIPFAAADWKACDASRRGCMVANLFRKVNFVGMPEREISELLGPPDREKNGTLFYDLGVRNGLDMDEDHLMIDLDKSRVATFAQLRS